MGIAKQQFGEKSGRMDYALLAMQLLVQPSVHTDKAQMCIKALETRYKDDPATLDKLHGYVAKREASEQLHAAAPAPTPTAPAV